MIPEYNPLTGIARLTHPQSGISVCTLLQQPGRKQPAITAFAGARFSRSADSLPDIVQEIADKNTNAAERLATIFQGYGHSSVADMSHQFISIENVPAVTAMRFFWLNPKQDGQERSTRYQDFSKPNFARTYPTALPTNLRKAFEIIITHQLAEYSKLLTTTQSTLANTFNIADIDKKQVAALKARSFDCARQLLPLGVNTSFCAVMSSRDWGRYISLMRGSTQKAEQIVGDLLFHLLLGTPELAELGYTPEADTLIRHLQPNFKMENTTHTLLAVLQNKLAEGQSTLLIHDYLSANCMTTRSALVEHILMRHKSGARLDTTTVSQLSEWFGKWIHKEHSQYNQLGPIAQHGAYQLKGFADIGVLKDLNRHRSMERDIAFLDNQVELAVINNPHWGLTEYLTSISTLRPLAVAYMESLNDTQQMIDGWLRQASDYLSKSAVIEFARYLSPTARRVEYAMYGSIDDLQYTIRTRVRPGGHINYRRVVYQWAKQLSTVDPFWKPLLLEIEEPDATSREQFLDRS